MAIVNTINSSHELQDEFEKFNRSENFSYQGMKALFEYLEGYSEDTGENIELDVIALCCDYSEDTIEDIISNYSIDVSDADGDEDEIRDIVREYLENKTTIVGETDEGFVYAVF